MKLTRFIWLYEVFLLGYNLGRKSKVRERVRVVSESWPESVIKICHKKGSFNRLLQFLHCFKSFNVCLTLTCITGKTFLKFWAYLVFFSAHFGLFRMISVHLYSFKYFWLGLFGLDSIVTLLLKNLFHFSHICFNRTTFNSAQKMKFFIREDFFSFSLRIFLLSYS